MLDNAFLIVTPWFPFSFAFATFTDHGGAILGGGEGRQRALYHFTPGERVNSKLILRTNFHFIAL